MSNKLRVFISSTCYDLGAVREHLRAFINSCGYDAIMSDYNDVLYDFREHTHSNCLDGVITCDILVVLIGSRFGGEAVPEASSKLDFDILSEESKSRSILKEKKFSITQLEVLKAMENRVPIFTFIDSRVMNDHALYEKNKQKEIISQITFPSIEKVETAKYIFEFINFLRHRRTNNAIFSFSKIHDIENTLVKQLSSLFQKLLSEQRRQHEEVKKINQLSSQLEDLKTAILSTIDAPDEREIAKWALKYRRLADFLYDIGIESSNKVIESDGCWEELLESVEIVSFCGIEKFAVNQRVMMQNIVGFRPRTVIKRSNDSHLVTRAPYRFIQELSKDYDSFLTLSKENRKKILDALYEMKSQTLVFDLGYEFQEENPNDFDNMQHKILMDSLDEDELPPF